VRAALRGGGGGVACVCCPSAACEVGHVCGLTCSAAAHQVTLMVIELLMMINSIGGLHKWAFVCGCVCKDQDCKQLLCRG
jgi:hypothetical protein